MYMNFKVLENLDRYRVVLASNSPRRKELLEGLGLKFEVRTVQGIDESYPGYLRGKEIAEYISMQKAAAYSEGMAADELIITADTIVCIDGQVLGKPADAAEARAMLCALSGREHEVITGVAVQTQEVCDCFSVTSRVVFADLDDDEIDFYVQQFRPFDKAGAYGIQEWIGLIGVYELHGSYFNVMGLPVQRLYQVLKRF